MHSGASTDPAAFAQLVRRARRGNRRAWSQLYAQTVPRVRAALLSRVPAADADDLCHDVYVTALRRLEQLRDPERFTGWLLTIARNRATDYFRAREAGEALSDELADSKRTSERAEAEQVLRAIEKLPEAYREPLLLRLVAGLSGVEIARETGLTAGSVRVNLSRGLKLLRQRLNEDKP